MMLRLGLGFDGGSSMAWTAEQKRKFSERMKQAWAARKAKPAAAAKPHARSAGGKYRCPRCGKSFMMAAHLGRHMSAIHGQHKRAAAKSVRRSKRMRSRTSAGMPSGITELASMPMDEL